MSSLSDMSDRNLSGKNEGSGRRGPMGPHVDGGKMFGWLAAGGHCEGMSSGRTGRSCVDER